MAGAADGWGMAWRVARRELRAGLHGFRIFILCLMIGVAAIAAVRSVSGAILDALERDGRSILGGDLLLRSLYQPPPAAAVALLGRMGRLSTGVEMRAMARDATDGGAGASTLVELKAVDGLYPLAGSLSVRDADGRITDDFRSFIARQSDKQWGALADPALLARLGLTVGDRLALGDTTVRVTGEIVREPDRAAGDLFELGPRLLVSLDAMPATDLTRPGSLVYYLYRLVLPAGETPDGARDDLARAFPEAGWRVLDFRNASPGLRNFITRLTMFMTLTGLTALLVGGVGVANGVRGYLEGRQRTIAMLKCVGASGALIFRSYLIVVMVLALLGTALGLVLGALVPLVVGGLIEDLLPIRVVFGVGLPGLGLAGLFGLLVALAFSVWPLGYAHDVPAATIFRDAYRDQRVEPRRRYVLLAAGLLVLLAVLAVVSAPYRQLALGFVVGAAVLLVAFNAAGGLIVRFARWLGGQRLRLLRRPLARLALTNLHRPGTPAPTVVLSLGLGLTVLVAIALIEGNFARAVNDRIPERAPSFFFLDIQPAQLAPFRAMVSADPGVSDFRATPMLRGRIVKVNGIEARQALVDPDEAWVLNGDRGVTHSASPPDQGALITGKWWPAAYQSGRDGPPLVSIAEVIAKAFGIGPGDELTVNILGRDVTATVANVRKVDWGTVQINFTLVYAPGLLESAPQTWLATLRAPPETEARLQRQVPARFANISLVRIRDAIETISGILAKIALAVRVTAAVTLVAGTLVLAGAIAAGHRRRVYDAVVLKVVGATRARIFGAFLLEYGLMGLATALIAGLAGTLTAFLVLTGLMGMAWHFLPAAVLWTLLLACSITVLLGMTGTWLALGHKPAPYLRNE